MAGGLLRSPGSHLRVAIDAGLPDYTVSLAPLEPAHGAVLMAADQAGVRLSRERLLQSGPAHTFFATAETG